MINQIHKLVQMNIPILGICLGMQILFDSGDESTNSLTSSRGLSLLSGTVSPVFPDKLPIYGFHDVFSADSFVISMPHPSRYYFMHSYSVQPSDPSIITSTYKFKSAEIVSSIQHKNIFMFSFIQNVATNRFRALFSIHYYL